MKPLTFQEPFNQPFQEAIDFLKQKTNLPTQTWRDIEGRSHDRAFVVAGAMKDALLQDLRGAIGQALKGAMTLEQFRKAFDAIVARHGWTGWTGEGSEAGRAWRTRVIYETNLKTAHAAGRYRQMTDPDVVKVYEFWRYRHAYYRTPERARPEHRDVFDGTTLRWDDSWWQAYYPPNGWNCSCGVETLTQDDLDDEGKRPDPSPTITTRKVKDPKTGEWVDVPLGIDLGWDHAPGRDWSRGVVPKELQKPLQPLKPSERQAPVLSSPMPAPRAFQQPSLPKGLAEPDYVNAFLAEFDAAIGQPRLFRDAAGHAIPISDQMFRDSQGRWKVLKRGRELELLRLAETLKEPDEIWLQWHRSSSGEPVLFRNYLRQSADGQGFCMFSWSSMGWKEVTAFAPDTRGYLLKQRQGALLWRREE